MAYKQLTDAAALALSGTTSPEGLVYPIILSNRWAEAIYKGLNQFLAVSYAGGKVLEIEGNADAIGILPMVVDISGVVLEYAGSAGAAVIDGITNNDTTLIWAYDNSSVIGFSSALESAGWPATPHIKLAKVVMDAGVMTITDMRGASIQKATGAVDDISAITPTDSVFIVGNGTNWVGESGATVRTSLGLVIGTDVQAFDAGLLSIAGLTTSADKMIYTTASDTYAVTSLSSFARTFLDDTSAAAVRTTVGAAASGSNGDITDLTALASPLVVPTPTAANHAATKGYVDGAIQGLDWQESVLDRNLTAPPGGESPGDRYIVAAGATGDWSGNDDQIAEYNGASWDFTVPNEGASCRVEDEDRQVVWNGSAWVGLGAGIVLDDINDGATYVKTATTTLRGMVKQIAVDADITDNSGGTPASTIAAATNTVALTDSTSGTADDTVDAVSLTDSSAGTADGTVQALTNPVDSPGSPDTLRDDLVANLIPELRNNFAECAAELNQANNNFTEIADQLATQRALNTVLVDAVASLAAEVNDLRAKARTAGVLAT